MDTRAAAKERLYSTGKYDEKTRAILRGLQESYPFLNFFFKDIPELTRDSMRRTMHRMFLCGIVTAGVVAAIVILMIYSLATFEDDPQRPFIENIGYGLYYTLAIGYSLPISYILTMGINVAWIYFKLN